MLLKALNFEKIEENESVMAVEVQLSDITDFPAVMFTSESIWIVIILQCDQLSQATGQKVHRARVAVGVGGGEGGRMNSRLK